jgi:hypothetical protein
MVSEVGGALERVSSSFKHFLVENSFSFSRIKLFSLSSETSFSSLSHSSTVSS